MEKLLNVSILCELKAGTVDEVLLLVRCLVTKATNYDLLLKQEVMFPPGVCIDNKTEQVIYRPDWKIGGLQLAYMPLDLHSTVGDESISCFIDFVWAQQLGYSCMAQLVPILEQDDRHTI